MTLIFRVTWIGRIFEPRGLRHKPVGPAVRFGFDRLEQRRWSDAAGDRGS